MTTSPIQRRQGRGRQRGVVLIIALVMLVIISMLAALSIRNAQSSEGVSGNVRTTQLATEAAEIALRICESSVIANVKSPFTALPTGMTINSVPAGTPLGVTTTNWDSTRTGIYVLQDSDVNGSSTTYQRNPECVIERLQVVSSTGTLTTTTTYLITARGFGPEVADGTGRPTGTEVFLQSTLEVE